MSNVRRGETTRENARTRVCTVMRSLRGKVVQQHFTLHSVLVGQSNFVSLLEVDRDGLEEGTRAVGEELAEK
jgi:hypothetical protein